MRPPLVGSTCGPGGSARPRDTPASVAFAARLEALLNAARTGRHYWRLADGQPLVLAAPGCQREPPEHLVVGTGPYWRMHPDPAVEHRAYSGGAPPRVATGLVVMSSPRGANTARRILSNAYGMLSADQKPR